MNRKKHWDKVYEARGPGELTWFQQEPVTSLRLIRRMGLGPEARVLDVGGGTSHLAHFLLQEGFRRVSVLDVSGKALARAKTQLGPRAEEIEWFEEDLLDFDPADRWVVWHDRAVFHFLTLADDRKKYCQALRRALEPGGHLIIATFAMDGPTRCSGLDCVQYSPESLHSVIGSEYRLRGSLKEEHITPKGGTQNFLYSWFQRESEACPSPGTATSAR